MFNLCQHACTTDSLDIRWIVRARVTSAFQARNNEIPATENDYFVKNRINLTFDYVLYLCKRTKESRKE